MVERRKDSAVTLASQERTGAPATRVSQVLVGTIFFGLVMPIMIMGVNGRTLAGIPELLRWIVVIYAAQRLSSLIASGQPRWASFAFWMFGYPFLTLHYRVARKPSP